MSPTFFLRQLNPARFTGLSINLAGGHLTLEVPAADVDYIALEIACAAARPRGVDIQSVQTTFEPDAGGSLRFQALVTACKMMFTVQIRLTGRLVVNDVLQAVATDLRAHGEGVMGDLAALAIQPELGKYADRPFPLTLPAGLPFHLSSVRLEAGPPLRIIAALF